MNKDNLSESEKEYFMQLECWDCPSNEECPYAWEEYNIKGSWCLAEK